MTKTELNANALKNSAMECIEYAQGKKWTIEKIVAHWNICVEQSGFTGTYDFPVNEYKRKSWLISDLKAAATQLTNVAAGRDAITGEPLLNEIDTREWSGESIERDHAEALEMDGEYQLAIATIADNLTLPVWEGCSDTVKAEVVKHHHAEALEINAIRAFRQSPAVVMQTDFWAANDYAARRELVRQAHAEALDINAFVDAATCSKEGLADFLIELKELDHAEALKMNMELCGGDNQEYQIYLSCADDGRGNELMTGKPLKTYEEWLNS